MLGLLRKHKQNKMFLKIIFLFIATFICAEGKHKLCEIFGCFDSGDTQLSSTLDGEETYYADFTKKQVVWDSKVPTSYRAIWAYNYAVVYRYMCKYDRKITAPEKSSGGTKQQPDTVLYARNEVTKDEENKLICFSNNFFPPKINITWTKNNKEVKEENSFIKTIPNYDGTFHVFSYLKFVPEQGDIYSCTVEHEALEEPLTRFWDVKTEKARRASSVFCGLGLLFGVIGIAAGTFFFVKGKHNQSIPNSGC